MKKIDDDYLKLFHLKIKHRLALRGYSLTAVAASLGVRIQSVRTVTRRGEHVERVEVEIARLLGQSPEKTFPHLYARNPIRRQRARQREKAA